MLQRIAVFLLAAFALAGPALAQAPFDPRAFRSALAGEPTQVLVLGTAHLSGAAEDFDPDWLDPLLERLAALRPDAIFVENLSGEEIRRFQEYEAIYPGVVRQFGGRPVRLMGLARESLGIDTAAAEAEVRDRLRAAAEHRAPDERRRLAALFAAAGDPASALVQWWRLPAEERRPGDGLSEALAEELEALAARRNESTWIGSRLAARLGLERVHPMDDHSATDLILPRLEQIGQAFAADPDLVAVRDSPALRRLAGAAARMASPEAVLEVYRELNDPASLHEDALLQWQTLLRARLPDGLGRIRVAEWEARNLRMAANIREGLGLHPGGRALVIVGASHKPYLDAYLDLMSDVEVVDAAEILSPRP